MQNVSYRQFTTGFFFGKPTHETQIYDNNTYQKGAVYLGQVKEVTEDGYVVFFQKNKFRVGDMIEIMKKNGENQTVSVLQMLNEVAERQIPVRIRERKSA